MDKISNNEKLEFADLDKSKIVRNAVYGFLSAKNYRDIELARVDYIFLKFPKISKSLILDKLNCDAFLGGEILEFKNDYFVTYSVTTVKLHLKLFNKNGNILWESQNAASSHEGSIPLTPISLITGVFTATSNLQDEVAIQMVDTAVRRTMSTLPDRSKFNINDEIIVRDKIMISQSNISENQISVLSLLTKGAYEEALKVSKIQMKNDPNIPDNYFFAGQAELFLKNYDQSIDYFLTGIAKGNKSYEIFSMLGVAYLKKNNLRLAAASFNKGVMVNPNSSFLYFNLAVLNEKNYNLKLASTNYFKAGEKALIEKNYKRLYRSLKGLKRLSKKHKVSEELYGELGLQVQNLLRNNQKIFLP